MKKGLKCGLIAGTLACAFAFTTPMLVGCGCDDNKTEQQQINLNSAVSGKFVLAMADALGLRISSTTAPTDAETVIMRAQRYAQNMLKVLDKNSIKLGDVYELEIDHKSSRPENVTYKTTDTYRIKLEVKGDVFMIHCTQVGTKDTSATQQAQVSVILNTVGITYKDGVISKISDNEYQEGENAPAFIKTTTIATGEPYTFSYADMTATQKSDAKALLTSLKGNVASDHRITITD